VGVHEPATDGFVAKVVDDTPPPTPTGSQPTRSEESAATAIGFWRPTGARPAASAVAASLLPMSPHPPRCFSFTGTAVRLDRRQVANVCGIAACRSTARAGHGEYRRPQRTGQPHLRIGVLRLQVLRQRVTRW